MNKVVYNSCYGGFDLSKLGLDLYNEKREQSNLGYKHNARYIERDDKLLIEVVEQLGKLANGPNSDLKIFEIPKEFRYEIKEHDGAEWVEFNPYETIENKLNSLQIETMTDVECRWALQSLQEMIKNKLENKTAFL
jgi:hypothetical protein